MFERSSFSELLRSEVERLPLSFAGGAKGKKPKQNRQQDGLIASDQVITNRMPAELKYQSGRHASPRYGCAFETILPLLDVRACFIDASLRCHSYQENAKLSVCFAD
jgi:hypothetical protein